MAQITQITQMLAVEDEYKGVEFTWVSSEENKSCSDESAKSAPSAKSAVQTRGESEIQAMERE